MPQPLPVDALFAALDRKDLGSFLSFLGPNCRLQYGNHQAVVGLDAIAEVVSRFFEQIAELRHEIAEHWQIEDTVICHGVATYTRHDGTTLSVPIAHIMTLDEGLISDYRVFLDISSLFPPIHPVMT
jgi:ketosteroid isomerase-like protein